jgi:VWFA-related protein
MEVLGGLTRRVLLGAGLLRAQDVTFKSDVKVVNLLATVRGKNGELVRDLTQEDFVLLEKGRPQKIQYFSQQSDLPLRLGLLVDVSMSQERVLDAERAASYRFFDRVLREKQDEVFVITFETMARVRLGFSSSRKDLEAALAFVETPTRKELQAAGYSGTAVYDAVGSGAELMKKPTGRKALLLLSDGVDSTSTLTLPQVIEECLKTDTLVYSVYFAGSSGYGVNGRGVMERLARETGGGFFEINKRVSAEAVFDAIQEELRSQYSIGYVSDEPVGYPAFRKITLTTKQKGLRVQTRDGYWPRR